MGSVGDAATMSPSADMKSEMPTTLSAARLPESSAIIKIADRFKRYVPETIKNALSNCGGVNRRPERFAGRLLDQDLDDEQYVAILHSLIFPGGIRKTTNRARNLEILREAANRNLLPRKSRLRVLDVGAGAGLDAMSTFAFLRQYYEVEKYALGDLFTAVLYDEGRGLVFDEDGNLLQVLCGRKFVSIHFSYNYGFQRVTNLFKRIHAKRLSKRYLFDPLTVVRIPLVHRELDVTSSASPFRLERMSAFELLKEKFDLIICMHLLVRRYFSEDRIAVANENLSQGLNAGGTLISGTADTVTIVQRVGAESFTKGTLRR